MKDINIAVIGLGYVGLPLARLFSTKYPTVGYDLNPERVEELDERARQHARSGRQPAAVGTGKRFPLH